jgi:hypothetical protein
VNICKRLDLVAEPEYDGKSYQYVRLLSSTSRSIKFPKIAIRPRARIRRMLPDHARTIGSDDSFGDVQKIGIDLSANITVTDASGRFISRAEAIEASSEL